MNEILKSKLNQVNIVKKTLIYCEDKNLKSITVEKLKELLLEIEKLIFSSDKKDKCRSIEIKREFTLKELVKYNGQGGKNAYVAIKGTVYDLTSEKSWINGVHHGLIAGKDLTDEFMKCHKNDINLKDLNIIGTIKE